MNMYVRMRPRPSLPTPTIHAHRPKSSQTPQLTTPNVHKYISTHRQTILRMEHVTFTYPGRDAPQLKDVSLRVSASYTLKYMYIMYVCII